MPQIKQYNQDVEAVGPVNGFRATNEGLNVGSNLIYAGQQVEKGAEVYQRHQELNDISSINAQMAGARADLANDWQDRLAKADPNDKDLATNFNDTVQQRFDQIANTVQTPAGRRRFNVLAANAARQFVQSAASGQMELGRVKAQQDYVNTVDGLSSSLLNDPSSFQSVMDQHKDSIEGLVESGGLDRATALKLQTQGETELSKSAVRGWIKIDPAAAEKQLNDGEWDGYVGADLKHQLLAEAKQGVAGQDADKRRQAQMDADLKLQAQMKTQNDFLDRLQKGTLTWNDIKNSNLDAFGQGSKEQFRTLMDKAMTDKKMTTNPTLFTNLFQQIHATDGDPKKITDPNSLNQYVGKGLTIESLNQLRNEISGKKTLEGDLESKLKNGLMETAKSKLTRSNPMLGIKDPDGEENLLAWTAQFIPEYNKQRAAGKTPVQLLDPQSPDYLGKTLGTFVKSPAQIMNETASRIRTSSPQPSQTPTPSPTPIPRKPGETIEEWKARAKKERGE